MESRKELRSIIIIAAGTKHMSTVSRKSFASCHILQQKKNWACARNGRALACARFEGRSGVATATGDTAQQAGRPRTRISGALRRQIPAARGQLPF